MRGGNFPCSRNAPQKRRSHGLSGTRLVSLFMDGQPVLPIEANKQLGSTNSGKAHLDINCEPGIQHLSVSSAMQLGVYPFRYVWPLVLIAVSIR